MSKKKAHKQKQKAPKPSKPAQRNVVVVISLLLCLVFAGSILAQWRSTHMANRMNAMLAPTPIVPGPGSPSKEYIYAGGRLLATEEPVGQSTPTATPTPTPPPSGTQNIVWTNIVGASATGNTLTSSSAANGWGTSGASSTQSISSGDGYMEFTATETNSHRMCGLSNGDTNQTYQDIDFAVYLAINGEIYIYESGAYVGYYGIYAAGDVFRVSIENGVVKYRKNGSVFYSSTRTPTYPLLVDSSFFLPDATITNAIISGTLTP